jgi:ribA/ribD-fused uncharacterized protein
MTIYFYTTKDEHGYCSNFSAFGIEVDSQFWPTVEHYFQAQKFTDPAYQEKIFKALTPKVALSLGHTRSIPLRENWEDIKDEVMYFAVKKKFSTHSKIKEKLLATFPEDIIESSPNDYYWGCGQDGTGQNKLGKILMRVRDELLKDSVR